MAIVSGNHLEDFDVEVESRKQLKGNIYLAKVTRVEPSLQAAFVDYGGNRHGFLAFSEIHPDYYQIPVADRQKLLAEQQVEGTEAEARDSSEDLGAETAGVETLGGDDSEEVEARRPVAPRRHYRIQEVIKRRQILLIQVVKEERGTKGAALTTYLSLAGRYCVLMPNTARGGGISRKIAHGTDRKRLKSILGELDIPDGVAVIVRTAGQTRSKAEIKRDYEYLMGVWSSVREVTLESMAPCLVHEEGNLVKRSIRDLYSKEIGEIIIDGAAGYRAAKDLMKLLIPSHTKRVQPFKEVDKQLFQFYGIESQLAKMHSPEVQLKSGGYIVINPTEALVSIDVNSGRATRGRNIEETALKTNIEAADEIARQLRLRDLAGLIVIDFIDMEDRRNQGKVERRVKDAMRSDRARIQVGRISPFGLLELSRQRLRPSLIETSSEPCPYCEGTGVRRSRESAALHLLRAIEEEGMQHRAPEITVYTPSAIALHILNHKRAALSDIESKYRFSVVLENDDSLIPPDYRIERIKGESRQAARAETAAAAEGGTIEEGGKRRRRPRRRRGKDTAEQMVEAPQAAEAAGESPGEEAAPEAVTEVAPVPEKDAAPGRAKRRRRGRRGGRRRGGRKAAEQRPMEATGAPSGDAAEGRDGNVILLGGPEPLTPPTPPSGDKTPTPPSGDKTPAPPSGDKTPTPPSGDATGVIVSPDASGETAAKKKPARQRAATSAAAEGKGSVKKKAEKPEKPAKRTRARKTKKAEADTAAEAAAEVPGEALAGDKAKPARKTAARKPRRPAKPRQQAPADGDTAVGIAVEVPADAGEQRPETVSPLAAEPPEVASPNAGDTSKTTVVTVGAGAEQDQDSKKPSARKGWWNRA